MPVINPTLPNDGETIDASDVNNPFNAILAVLNGAIDSNNIAAGSLPWSVMSASISNSIPAAAMQDGANIQKYRSEADYPYVASGCVWTGDSYGGSLNGSMSAGTVYIGGYRIPLAAVTAHAFTLNSDTYVDVLSNSNNTGTIGYTTVANNTTPPALAANSIRLAIVVTGATSIAAVTSINQGQPTAVLPIISSVPFSTTDSLGNLICPRDRDNRLLGYIERTNGQSAFVAAADVTGVAITVKIPANCFFIFLAAEFTASDGSAATTITGQITDSANVVQMERSMIVSSSNINALQTLTLSPRKVAVTPGSTYTFKLRVSSTGSTTVNQGSSANKPSILQALRA